MTALDKWRKRRHESNSRAARWDARVRTRLIRLAQRPALAAYLAREYDLVFRSGWRSVEHNAAVHGVPGSWHTKGTRRNPAASDLTGTEANMARASQWVAAHVPDVAENMVHDVGSGRHLHVAGWGVMRWRMPQHGQLRRWRRKANRWRKRAAHADTRVTELQHERGDAAALKARKQAAKLNGARYVDLIFKSAQKHDVPLPLALALFEQESVFQNQYGHDRAGDGNIIWHGKSGRVMVTETNYAEYKKWRNAHGLAQGVGPGQLTSPGFQDLADKRGGCWKPAVNIDVSLEILAGHIDALGEARGIGAYNGGRGRPNMDYAASVARLQVKWERLLP